MTRHVISKAGDGFSDDPANSFTPDSAYYFDPGVYAAETRLIFQRSDFDPVFGEHATCLNVVPPCMHILDQDVHHEILGQRFGTEILQ